MHVHAVHGRSRGSRADARARRRRNQLQRRRDFISGGDFIRAGLDRRASAHRAPSSGRRLEAPFRTVRRRARARGERLRPRRVSPGVREGQPRHIRVAARDARRGPDAIRRAEVHGDRRRGSKGTHAQLHPLRRRSRARHRVALRRERHVRVCQSRERRGGGR